MAHSARKLSPDIWTMAMAFVFILMMRYCLSNRFLLIIAVRSFEKQYSVYMFKGSFVGELENICFLLVFRLICVSSITSLTLYV